MWKGIGVQCYRVKERVCLVMDKFSPKKIDKEIISIRVSVDLLKRVDDEATKADISRNEMINQCIDYALGHLEKQ